MGNMEQFKAGKISPMEDPITGKGDIDRVKAENASKALLVERKGNLVDARSVFNRQSSPEEIGNEIKRVNELCKRYMDEVNPQGPINMIKLAYANRDLKSAREISSKTVEEIQQHIDFIKTDGREDLESAKKKLESVREYYIHNL